MMNTSARRFAHRGIGALLASIVALVVMLSVAVPGQAAQVSFGTRVDVAGTATSADGGSVDISQRVTPIELFGMSFGIGFVSGDITITDADADVHNIRCFLPIAFSIDYTDTTAEYMCITLDSTAFTGGNGGLAGILGGIRFMRIDADGAANSITVNGIDYEGSAESPIVVTVTSS